MQLQTYVPDSLLTSRVTETHIYLRLRRNRLVISSRILACVSISWSSAQLVRYPNITVSITISYVNQKMCWHLWASLSKVFPSVSDVDVFSTFHILVKQVTLKVCALCFIGHVDLLPADIRFPLVSTSDKEKEFSSCRNIDTLKSIYSYQTKILRLFFIDSGITKRLFAMFGEIILQMIYN